MLVAAGWLESLYLATRHTDKANEELRNRIAEQKLVMEDVIDLVSSYEQSPGLTTVIQTLEPVVAAFDAVTREEARPTTSARAEAPSSLAADLATRRVKKFWPKSPKR